MFRACAAVVVLCLAAVQASAQDRFWVQVEAHPTLGEATERARVYARRFDDIEGYYLGRGFYGIVLGPYSERLARAELSRLLSTGQVPSDSYLQNGRRFEQQFWPIGGAANVAPIDPLPEEETPQEAGALPIIPLTAPFETFQQARASERALSREDREELQRALRWAGFYDAAIDGSFGRGTRSAMEAWQFANAKDPNGVLNARERELLLQQYNAVLIDVDMKLVRDRASGIEVQIPTAVVEFAEYQPPFVKFDGLSSLPSARVLLISQQGNAERLAGLFEVLQVLDIIPTEGPRQLGRDGFVIEGVDNDTHAFATASVENGEIKGFVLVWPARDDQRRQRIVDVMQSSFTRIEGTLDPNIVPPSADQAIDMVAGLAVRQPKLSRSGFYVSADGTVVTTSQAVESCERITFDRTTRADVLATDPDLGVAILRPQEPLAPIAVANFQSDLPRLQDRIAVAGYPFNGVLTGPTLTFGALEDIRSLDGDERLKRLSVMSQSSNAGGPVLAESGAVLGMLLPRTSGTDQTLPPEVQFSLDAEIIVGLLEAQDVVATQSAASPAISSVALSRKAADMSVLVSCW